MTTPPGAAASLVGVPASPGRASGPARVIRRLGGEGARVTVLSGAVVVTVVLSVAAAAVGVLVPARVSRVSAYPSAGGR